MFKKLSKKLFGNSSEKPSGDGFFLDVCCNTCGEEFHLFVHTSHELFPHYHEDDSITYSLKKEIIGSGCRNKIQVTMEFDAAKRMKSREIQNGKFLEK
jgi:hypothetical protein